MEVAVRKFRTSNPQSFGGTSWDHMEAGGSLWQPVEHHGTAWNPAQASLAASMDDFTAPMEASTTSMDGSFHYFDGSFHLLPRESQIHVDDPIYLTYPYSTHRSVFTPKQCGVLLSQYRKALW